MESEFDLIAIGDITTDAFIRLKDAHKTCSIDMETCELCLRFGDKVPYEFVEVVPGVGNSANAAVASARLGLSTTLVSDIGEDQNGNDCLTALAQNHVDTSLIVKHPGRPTNYHYVLWYAEERTILVKHTDYEYSLPELPATSWIYLSSLGANSLVYHDQIAEWLEKNPSIKLAFQPGTFQISAGPERLKALYARTEIFFCNVNEAEKILGTPKASPQELLKGIHEHGPKIVVITDGPKGAYAFDGTSSWFIPPYPDQKPPYERTGAGDAFASTVVAALALGKSLEEALLWGPANSMAVVQEIGAQQGLLTRKEIEALLAKAPKEYQLQVV